MDVESMNNEQFKQNTATPGVSSTIIEKDGDESEMQKLESEEVLSEGQVKRILSFHQPNYNPSATTFACPNKSSEKIAKVLRTSSTTLERDHHTASKQMSGILFFGESKLFKDRSDSYLLDVIDMKKYALATYIHDSPNAADLKWSLFCSACHSYRYDSVLRPFPPMFLKNDTKDIERLRDVTESCPGIPVLFDELQKRNSPLLSVDLIHLLYWVLIHLKEPQLKYVPKEKHSFILSSSMRQLKTTAPHHIFQVQYNKMSNLENYDQLLKNQRVIRAYHGTRLDNFFSIINYGLRISYNKLADPGPGVHLSSEISTSLSRSPTGFGWGASHFGSQISIVAMCDLIDNFDVNRSSDEDDWRKKCQTSGTAQPNIFVVSNSDLICVKYLLVYCTNVGNMNNNLPAVVNWFNRNKVIVVILAYLFILLAIATSRSSNLYKFYRRMVRNTRLRLVNL